jgi:hypothetical protein
MNNKMPRTPFSTRLSRSAKETEIRIRNIFSGPKKRPPALLMLLVAALILLCGNLVAFRPLPAQPTLVMETQYYDTNGNYVEIPALALPAGEENDAVEAINTALNGLRKEYSDLASRTGTDAVDNQCLFYPSTTSRYLNLLFYRDTFTTDLNTGHVFSLVYSLKEGTLVSTEDALARAGLNEKGLLDQVTEQVQTQIDRDYQEYGFQLTLHNLTLEGFRIKADGQPVFYLTGWVDDVDDAVLDAISGAGHLYIWEDRAVTTYNRYSGDSSPLVPAGETDKLDPPLWCRWFFAGEEPAGGFVDKSLLEPAADLYDPEVCLYRDGYSTPIGPGNWAELFPEFEPEVEIFESWRTDPQAGHVESWSIDGGGEEGGVSAERFYDAEADRWHIYRMETGRSDMYTPRGIRVGATREEVLAAYPGLLSDEKNWQWAYPDDYLWYCANENGLGPYLYFFFTDDVVYMIQMGIQYKY